MTWRVPGDTSAFSILVLVSGVRSFAILCSLGYRAVFGAAIERQKSVPTLYPRMASVPTVHPPRPMARTLPRMAEYGHKSRSFGGYRWTALVRCGKDHSLGKGEVDSSILSGSTRKYLKS